MTESNLNRSPTSSPERTRFSVGDFLFQFVATAIFVGLIVLPMHAIEAWKKIFEDFKLELPAPTQLAIDIYDLLRDIHADIWLWALPFLAPFLLARIRRETRGRLLLLAVLLAGVVSVFNIFSMQNVVRDLITSLSGPKR